MKKALLVIDMQNDYLWEGRKKKFSYKDVDRLVTNTNNQINKYNTDDCEIIYIAQIIPNVWWGRMFFGFSIKGTEGAKLYSKVNLISKNYFEKTFSDAFTNKEFVKFVTEKNINSVAICGIDEGGCVSATAKGALKHGLSVEILTNSIDTCYPIKKVEKLRQELKSSGARYI